MADQAFVPALVVVDFQNDFCAPGGALGVTGGKDIAPVVNELMNLPFALRVATQDWHPENHVSFASNHDPPNNKPFESVIVVNNPRNDLESQDVRLWPSHCVKNSSGAELVPEFDVSDIDMIVKKGQDSRVEMFSAFKDNYKSCVSESELGPVLRRAGTTHCYIVGLATDYCVKYTALHAASEGYKTFVVSEATRTVDQSPAAMTSTEEELKEAGIRLVSVKGHEVAEVGRIRNRG